MSLIDSLWQVLTGLPLGSRDGLPDLCHRRGFSRRHRRLVSRVNNGPGDGAAVRVAGGLGACHYCGTALLVESNSLLALKCMNSVSSASNSSRHTVHLKVSLYSAIPWYSKLCFDKVLAESNKMSQIRHSNMFPLSLFHFEIKDAWCPLLLLFRSRARHALLCNCIQLRLTTG